MTNYYLCSVDIAQQYCNGCEYKKVSHYLTDISIYYDWLDQDGCTYKSGWANAVLLKDLDEHIQTLLSLLDPVFRKVSEQDMSRYLLHECSNTWDIL